MRTLSPRRVIVLGGILAVGGVLMYLIIPALFSPMISPGLPASQDLYVLLSTILGVLKQVLVPFGAALVGAGLVMHYIDQRARLAILEPLDQSDVEA